MPAKWVVGATSMIFCTIWACFRVAWCRRSICSGMMVSIHQHTELRHGAPPWRGRCPSTVVANRLSAAPAKKTMEPFDWKRPGRRAPPGSGTPRRDQHDRAIDQTLSMISVGVTGITSRCSMVPCSRSGSAGGAGQDDGQHGDVVDDLHHPPNQVLFSSGLKRARNARSTGAAARRAVTLDELIDSVVTICCI